MSVVLVPHSQASIAPYVWSPLAGAQRAFESTVGFHASRVLGMDVLRTHFPGRKRIALQTSSMGTWRTPWICCLSRCRQRNVPIQVRPELPRLGISDPRKPVRLRGLDDRTAHVVDIGERLDEDEDCVGLCG